MATSSRFELLSKDNYDTWVLQMEALLIRSDVWEYTNGECKKPNASQEDELKKWCKNDKKARTEIILSISPSELKQVRGCDTSNEVWQKLAFIYASKGPARKATLLKQLMLQKLEEGGNVREHLKKFFDAVDKLDSMNVKINGDMLTIMLLYSLPASFENFRCAIESRDVLLSADLLQVKIIEESEARIQVSGNAVIALAANYPRKKTIGIKCFKCGKIGHKANVCFSKRKTITNKKDSAEAVYSATVDDSANAVKEFRGWILDSGCTKHLCGDEEVFSSNGEVKGQISK